MCRKRRLSLRQTESGFSLVSAIFLLVIIAALGVFMLSLSTMSQTSSAQDLQGSKAYQAANAGIEWGTFLVMTPENTSFNLGAAQAPYACAAPLTMPALAGALQGFNVTVSCAMSSTIEGGNTLRVYQITALATWGALNSPQYIERSITATIGTCRLPATDPYAPNMPC
jgi:MSHA biogenesis protein MshP